jgi:coatomer subunit beta
VNLSDIQLDIMDYIRPAECKNEDFRSMWAEFEWEVRFRHRSELLPV